jgi:CRP/FNR family transcriptional regulator, cyclic AMP receptor protein
MRGDKAAQLLRRTSLFGELSGDALLLLGERAVERSYRRGQLIFTQGDLGDSLFVVVEGLIKVFVTSDEGDEMVLVTLRPPETFGEIALVEGGRRSASAETLEPTTALALTRSTLLEVAAEHPALTESLLRAVGAVVRRLTEQASDLVFLDLNGRVAKLLLALAQDRGGSQGDEITLDLHVTQTDLAAMVGGSRQSVNQILRSFERRGYVEIQGRHMTLREVDLLRRRAGM